MFQPVQNVRLSDKVVTQMTQSIHSGQLKIGEKLPTEAQMAEQFGISRGILREALNILQVKGYIQRSPKGGTYISSTCDSDIGNSITAQVRNASYEDLIEFREAMECKVVQKVIERASDEQIQSLYNLCRLSDDVDKQGSIDYYFHYRLAECSGNPLFVVFLDMYYDTIREIAKKSYGDNKRYQQIQKEHLRIVNAIEKRNSRSAVAAVKSHFHKVAEHVALDRKE